MASEMNIPGLNCPVNYTDHVDMLLPNALSCSALGSNYYHYEDPESALDLLTLRELAMLQFMNSVTDKPDWQIKVGNDEIAQKWKDEVCADAELNFTPKMADWCIDELRHTASFWLTSAEGTPPVFVFNGDVVKSDSAVSSELKRALQEAVEKFEATIPESSRDWHPGSNKKVLDLVHPSLYPLVHGQTRILPNGGTTTLEDCIERCGEGESMKIFLNAKVDSTFSKKFQWLPCEVDISGDRAKVTSYINNLHPMQEKRLYQLIEKLIDASIPLWNATLSPLAAEDFVRERRIAYDKVKYDPDPRYWPKSRYPQPGPDDDDEDYYVREEKWIKEIRRLVYPEPEGKFRPLRQPHPFDLKEQYGDRGLQVIVKLANILLTPERPEYEGGSWHVEGQMNERIVATALYYYSNDNTTTSTLSFRQHCRTYRVDRQIVYEQSDHDWLFDVFGCTQSEPVQNVGKVETREGRLLTFPNILQHRVDPFKLADPSKPGHRKIVALFLVDPNIKIASTAFVPCQQQEWWWEAIMATNSEKESTRSVLKDESVLRKVPLELQDAILEDVEYPFDMKQAKALRLELMSERKAFILNHTEDFAAAAAFSLCEH